MLIADRWDRFNRGWHMKRLIGKPFDEWRVTDERVTSLYHSTGEATCGMFCVRCDPLVVLLVIASSGGGGGHVSVSLPDRCPSWEEMRFVKRAFFRPDKWAVEYHPPMAENQSFHDYCLHLWRPQTGSLPLPPAGMVAPRDDSFG